MTNEEALNLLETGSWFRAVYSVLPQSKADEVAEAINTVAKAIRSAPTREPLTLEQLREMDGQPVWVEMCEEKYKDLNRWYILHDGNAYLERVDDWELEAQEYGKTWLAYAYPPAQIDREAWVCPYCTPDVEGYVRKFGAYSIHNGMLETGHCKPQEIKYCPHCSRPLTE